MKTKYRQYWEVHNAQGVIYRGYSRTTVITMVGNHLVSSEPQALTVYLDDKPYVNVDAKHIETEEAQEQARKDDTAQRRSQGAKDGWEIRRGKQSQDEPPLTTCNKE